MLTIVQVKLMQVMMVLLNKAFLVHLHSGDEKK